MTILTHLVALSAGGCIAGWIVWSRARKRIHEAEVDALRFAWAKQVDLTASPEELSRRAGW